MNACLRGKSCELSLAMTTLESGWRAERRELGSPGRNCESYVKPLEIVLFSCKGVLGIRTHVLCALI